MLFALLGLGHIGVTYLVLKAWGREGVRDFGGFLFKALFRVEVRGHENIPAASERMIFTPNHVSLLDGPLLHAVLPVDAAFAVDTGIAKAWWAKPFMAMINAFKVDPTSPLATKHLVALVKSGAPLVIFPEGRITVTGGIMKVYEGAAMIADKSDAWIVPVRIEGAQRSTLSYLKPWQIKKVYFPKITITFMPKIKLSIDDNLRGKARRLASGAALQDVMIDAVVRNSVMDQTLFQGLANAWRDRDAGQPIVEDPISGKLTYRRLIAGAQTLALKLEPLDGDRRECRRDAAELQRRRRDLLCAAIAGPRPRHAQLLRRRGQSDLGLRDREDQDGSHLASLHRERQARRRSFKRLSATREDRLSRRVARRDRLPRQTAGLTRRRDAARALQRLTIRPWCCSPPARKARRKASCCSHRNILANAAQALARIDANASDKVFNALPVFHSFGLTGGLMMPLLAGIPVYLYPSPLHYRIIPELVYQTNATILFGTDTFLAGYARAAHAYDFRSLRLVIAGAEAVKERTRETYQRRFGLRILEGYGVTETAPVLAMNTPIANKPGTVGRLSPLMKARLEPVPGVAEGGRLFVAGPNVMLGYLRADNPGVLEPPPGGWYDTGDIVAIDADGFITIKGRAKRFAKIAGEMVSLSASRRWPPPSGRRRKARSSRCRMRARASASCC